jgi:hypothetical protein
LKSLQDIVKSLFPFRISGYIPVFIVAGDLLILISSFLGAIIFQGNNLDSLFVKPVYYWFFVFGLFSNNSLEILVAIAAIWIINIIFPAVAGSFMLLTVKLFRKT